MTITCRTKEIINILAEQDGIHLWNLSFREPFLNIGFEWYFESFELSINNNTSHWSILDDDEAVLSGSSSDYLNIQTFFRSKLQSDVIELHLTPVELIVNTELFCTIQNIIGYRVDLQMLKTLLENKYMNLKHIIDTLKGFTKFDTDTLGIHCDWVVEDISGNACLFMDKYNSKRIILPILNF